MEDLLVYNIGELVTCEGGPKAGKDMSNAFILNDAYFTISDGKFTSIGTGDVSKINAKKTIDANGKLVTPGLIDSHTHLVHGGSREHELEKKLNNVPYLDILKAGGGILSTVKSTRTSTKAELFDKAKLSLDTMLSYGVTTVESKSGYGLDLCTEVKQLEVSEELNNKHSIDLIHTFLGAHAVPNEYKGKKDEYVNLVIEMLKDKRIKDIATYVDIFCEDSVFNKEDSKKILSESLELGYKVKIHADEIVSIGGTELACELKATSADHLMAASDEGIEMLAKNKVVANILPGTSFNLNKDYARVRHMIEKGCIVALSSDYNPGSCPSENLQFIMTLATTKLKMRPQEVINAVTINAAKSLDLEDYIGSIEKGKRADFVIFESSNLPYIMYHFGINHTKEVYKNGELVFSK